MDICSECDQPVRAKGMCNPHYQKVYQPAYQKRRYEKRISELKDYLGNRCVQCGTSESLEFDHIDPSLKSFAITAKWKLPWEEIREELDKCQLLCHDHHLAKHASDHPHGTALRAWRGCTCTPCLKAKSDYRKEWQAGRNSNPR